jgi:hypothetical protein
MSRLERGEDDSAIPIKCHTLARASGHFLHTRLPHPYPAGKSLAKAAAHGPPCRARLFESSYARQSMLFRS